MELNESYWTTRYNNNQLGWDIGYPSPAITHFMDQFKDKGAKILIPGCGNAYEAAYLWKSGFRNVYLLDFSSIPLQKFKDEHPDFPETQLLNIDFFEAKGEYNFIIEQTFFCALHPELRRKYAEKMKDLLKPDGILIGLLFNIPLNEDRPPFGGNIEEYQQLFSDFFMIEKMETAYNSIPEREGSELFIKMKPKNQKSNT
ncbi:SAM-dependent methyltransferase [Marivirga tractuosa]|uniref:Thiopurine S-methyltransferase n=1 Tax=Marivirga tractuosa (strain ATCC 23168 / DSM 4126 / NBRC 15989 / NCIMB 1408 / VKM B-1430 / H-43) TaxID=643867 RepID=E4TM04_MARTH|nr:methyltransferase domain-containing protein [Marivirga tractuosa]ADR20295.1 thiopurine S-methyltransferase [Marivirga tractuosa DSM 4126]BDD15263.1 SAM-dependent methyltransferase [Marivirga tractuosa]